MVNPEIKINQTPNHIDIVIRQESSSKAAVVHIPFGGKSAETSRIDHWAGPDELFMRRESAIDIKAPIEERPRDHWAGPDELMR